MMKVAVFPDVLAHYRLPAFTALAGLRDEGYELHLFSAHRKAVQNIRLATEVTAPGASLPFPVHPISELRLGPVVLWQTGVIRAALGTTYDTLVIWGDFMMLSHWVAALACRLRRKRCLMWTHGVYGREGRLKYFVRVSFYRLASALLLYGNRSRHLLRDSGYPARDLYVIYNSLDHARQRQVRAALTDDQLARARRELFPDAAPGFRLLLYVSRLIPEKSVDLLLATLAELRRTSDRDAGPATDYRLAIVGAGPERAALEEQTCALGLADHVRFLGELYAEEVLGELFATADLCVSPGNVGLTAMHALVYGTPVATHSAAAYQGPEAEVISHLYNGVLFQRGSVEDLARQIRAWFVLDLARSEIRRRCHDLVDRYYQPDLQRDVFRAALRGDVPRTEWLRDVPV